ncbi:MAG TPA: hypothetical protein EYQ00_10670 [Dehalococcoidia bacterium]|jgi:hypothetical protein|nr:hypothetical protein [Dehalococcoidia bacterium]
MNTSNRQTDTLPEIWLVSSWTQGNNSEFSNLLGENYERAALIRATDISNMVIGGETEYNPNENEENERQYELIIRNMCLLARSFSEAGFLPILYIQVHSQFYLDAFCNYLRGGVLRFITLVDNTLTPPTDIREKGLFIQTSNLSSQAIVNSMIQNANEARIM